MVRCWTDYVAKQTIEHRPDTFSCILWFTYRYSMLLYIIVYGHYSPVYSTIHTYYTYAHCAWWRGGCVIAWCIHLVWFQYVEIRQYTPLCWPWSNWSFFVVNIASMHPTLTASYIIIRTCIQKVQWRCMLHCTDATLHTYMVIVHVRSSSSVQAGAHTFYRKVAIYMSVNIFKSH